MGCDIHMYPQRLNKEGDWEVPDGLLTEFTPTEIEEEGDGHWRVEDNSYTFFKEKDNYIGRSYYLFSIMTYGEVRGDPSHSIPALAPKDIPDDLGNLLQKYWEDWEDDAHTPSYFTLEELRQLRMELLITDTPNSQDISTAISLVEKVITHSFDIPENEDPANYRVVFWFDN